MHRPPRQQRVLQRRAHHRAGVVDAPERREVVGLAARVGGVERVRDAAHEHVAHDLEHARALALDGGADGVAVGVAALEEHDGAADRERGVGLVHRGGVHERGGEQRHERRAAVAPAAHVVDELVDRVGRRLALQRVGGDEPVPEQRALVPEHALRQAGGAAGVPEQEVVARAFDPRAPARGRAISSSRTPESARGRRRSRRGAAGRGMRSRASATRSRSERWYTSTSASALSTSCASSSPR